MKTIIITEVTNRIITEIAIAMMELKILISQRWIIRHQIWTGNLSCHEEEEAQMMLLLTVVILVRDIIFFTFFQQSILLCWQISNRENSFTFFTFFIVVPDNPELEPGASYSAFYYAQVNDDVAFTSRWYSAVTTQPSTDGGKNNLIVWNINLHHWLHAVVNTVSYEFSSYSILQQTYFVNYFTSCLRVLHDVVSTFIETTSCTYWVLTISSWSR